MLIANTLQLEGRPTRRQSFWAVFVQLLLRMSENCHFRASDLNTNIAIRFRDPDFLQESNNLVTRRRFHVFYCIYRKLPLLN